MYNQELFQNNSDTGINGNQNYINQDMDVNVNVDMNNAMSMQSDGAVQQRVVHRTFMHEVPHTCPIHTRIVNHHIYRHTYRPVYTCSEENVCSNVQCGSCCQYR